MPMKRYKPEQNVNLLRQIEVEIGGWPALSLPSRLLSSRLNTTRKESRES